ncbi:MAG: hypothetical protein A2020_11175 [Lentisphaerae bacterium GWF2_45_14]|nr:MAG: hypothetical protein A2020_11175 [Lentisphaerae bacterium GWF2_45_14]
MRKILRPFTLLEMLLATAIFCMIVLTLTSGLMIIRRTWEKTSKYSNQIELLVKLERFFDSAFRNAVPFTWKDTENKDTQIFTGERNSIIFAYFHRTTVPAQGAIRFVSIYQDNDKLVALWSNTPILRWAKVSASQENAEILCNNVKSVSFLYADKDDDEIIWTDDWDEENNENIPLAIQIKIEWTDGVSEQWLRRTAGSGTFESFHVRKENTLENKPTSKVSKFQ